MKKKLSHIAFMLLMTFVFAGNAYTQANTALSNLVSPTAVNQHLLPSSNNSLSLGSTAQSWRFLYIDSQVYIKDILAIHSRGTKNFFTGQNAGNLTLTGSNNSGFGQGVLNKLSSGNNNVGVGSAALDANTTGYSNVAVGTRALYNSAAGSQLVAIGDSALFSNSFAITGAVAVGAKAMFSNTSGAYNSAVGYRALYSNTTGSYNTANGYQALQLNNAGDFNLASGSFALASNTFGARNSATGHRALELNTSGSNNTANGCFSSTTNTTGSYNTATGAQSLYTNSTGSYNTAVGYYALRANITGSSSTASGYYALNVNTTGTGNTASGSYTLEFSTTGNYNSAFGRYSLGANITGNYNTGVGYNADVSSGNLTNATALGYNATATASNQVRIGNSSVTSIGGYANWSNISDGRFKKNIRENVYGLVFINKLKAVTYNLDITGLNNRLNKKMNEDPAGDAEKKAVATKEKVVYSGFVAQEVERAAKETGYEFSGVDAPENDQDLYGLRYAEFVVPLVKAVQELSEQNNELKKENNVLLERLEKIEALLKIKPSISLLHEGALQQNTPNPFSNNTTIAYTLPSTFSNACINITDAAGKLVKSVNISGSSRGTLNVDAGNLASGTYHYSLYNGKKIIDSKQLVIVK